MFNSFGMPVNSRDDITTGGTGKNGGYVRAVALTEKCSSGLSPTIDKITDRFK